MRTVGFAEVRLESRNSPENAARGGEWRRSATKKPLDSLGFPCPNRAFSKGCADPQPPKIFGACPCLRAKHDDPVSVAWRAGGITISIASIADRSTMTRIVARIQILRKIIFSKETPLSEFGHENTQKQGDSCAGRSSTASDRRVSGWKTLNWPFGEKLALSKRLA